MKKIILSLIFAAPMTCVASAIKIGVFQRTDKAQFQAQVEEKFKSFSHCKTCQLEDLTPYNELGHFDAKGLVEKIRSSTGFQILFFNWNEKNLDSSADLIKALNEQVAQGTLIVAAAGVPMEKEASCPLNKTLMGNVSQGIIIGELGERDRLLAQCYYGPEMLTAVRPPRELYGQGFAPLYFVAKFSESFEQRKAKDWYGYLMARKAKSKRIWPDLEEFFPR